MIVKKNQIRERAAMALLVVGVFFGALLYPERGRAEGFFATGPYLGIGIARFDSNSTVPMAEDKTYSATQLFGGFQVLGILGLEVGFVNFNGVVFDLGGGVTDHFENQSYYGRGNLLIPLMRVSDTTVSIFGSAGVHRWQTSEVVTGVTTKSSDVSPMVGGGLLLRSPRNAALRLEYEIFKDVGKVNKIDINQVNVSILYYF
ncbi:MAG: outer membrane beta-barrel protein [Sulfurifustaceae bacterium]